MLHAEAHSPTRHDIIVLNGCLNAPFYVDKSVKREREISFQDNDCLHSNGSFSHAVPHSTF